MKWSCPAIDHAIAFFPEGKVGPCCQIDSSYLKPAKVVFDDDRFADLKTESPPDACKICINNEKNGIPSYRQDLQKNSWNKNTKNIQFLDIRNTNRCNLKCRYCGPWFSDKWAKELDIIPAVQESDIPLDLVITKDLNKIYFTGGEPMLSHQHWNLLLELINKDMAKDVSLVYNSNLMLVEYKQYNVFDIWKNFPEVTIQASIDAIGKPLEYIRSGTKWNLVEKNIHTILKQPNIILKLAPVISMLNIWWLDELYSYAKTHNIDIDPIILHTPEYLALDVIPDLLKSTAIDVLERIGFSDPYIKRYENLINNNTNQHKFSRAVAHILYLDYKRKEKLFNLLPFDNVTKQLVIKNYGNE